MLSKRIKLLALFNLFAFRRRKNISEDYLNSIGVPCLGSIPQLKPKVQIDLSAELENRDSFAQIARNLSRELTEKNNVLVVTSPTESSGKSYSATHLALALNSLGRSVLLIDLDLRLPSLKTYLNLPSSQKGLEDLMIESFDPENSRFRYGPNLDVFCVNKIASDPLEFLESRRFRNFINTQKKKYDFVLLDTAPLLATIDAAIIAEISNAALLVLRSGVHDHKVVSHCVRTFSPYKDFPVFAIINGSTDIGLSAS